jgi:hypothetical protein
MGYILAFDIEATGQSLRRHFMACFAAVLIAPNGQIVATYKSFLAQPPGCTWEQRCLDEFWFKNMDAYIATVAGVANARPPLVVMAEFRQWMQDNVSGKDVAVVTDTAGFDSTWLEYNLDALGEDNCSVNYMTSAPGKSTYESPVDISSYMLGAAGATFDKSSMKSFCAAKGLEKPQWHVTHDHDPLNDATVIGLNAFWALTHNTAKI